MGNYSISKIIRNFFTKGHEQSINVKRNIFASFLFKALNIIIGLMLVPLVLHSLNYTKYGIWLTLSSIAGWMTFFQVGLGHGLRNRLAEALARDDIKLAKSYVSTAYAVLIFIMSAFIVAFLCINSFLNWANILKASIDLTHDLMLLSYIVFICFASRFILQLIKIVLIADQKFALSDGIDALSKIILLFAIFGLTRLKLVSLLNLGAALSITPIVVLFLFTLLLYTTSYRRISPSIKDVNIKHIGGLAHLGVRFFIIQISGVVLFSTDNIIISHLFGPAEVTNYNIARIYYGVPMRIFAIILSPLWSAFTLAYIRKDFDWINRIVKKMINVWWISCCLIVLMVVLSGKFYHFWVGDSIVIPLSLNILMALYAILLNWGSIFVHFLNGVGKVVLQVYICVIIAVVNIPLSILFAKYLKFGSSGVMLATCVCLFFGGVTILPVQYLLLVNNKARGIWNR